MRRGARGRRHHQRRHGAPQRHEGLAPRTRPRHRPGLLPPQAPLNRRTCIHNNHPHLILLIRRAIRNWPIDHGHEFPQALQGVGAVGVPVDGNRVDAILAAWSLEGPSFAAVRAKPGGRDPMGRRERHFDVAAVGRQAHPRPRPRLGLFPLDAPRRREGVVTTTRITR